MKKLIMFLMALAISAPALALIDDVAPPAWGDGNPISTAVWQLDEDEIYSNNVEPSCLQGTVGFYLATFDEDWTWEDGILYCEGSGLSAVVGVPEEGAGSYITCQVTVAFVDGEYDIDEPGIEIWSGTLEEGDVYLGETFPDMVDIGDGYYTMTATFGYSEDITHIGAVLRGTYGMMGIIIDAVIHEEGDPPVGAPRPGCIEKAPPIVVDSNDMPIYEPYDTGGPPPMGPTEGQLLVSLAWQPGEGLGAGGGYAESFTATVVVDPNGGRSHDDFIFPAGVPKPASGPPSQLFGFVTLTFDETNWDIPQPVIVEAVEDLDREGNQSYPIELTVTIDIADPNFGNPIPVIVKSSVGVVDNDIPYISVLPHGYLEDILSENSPGVPRCVNVTLSHEPTSDVEVRAFIESDYDLLADSMVVMDPSFEDSADPNHFLFTPGNYNDDQEICFEARDDDDRPDMIEDEQLEWIPGLVILYGLSDDIRYQDVEEDGELDPTEVDLNVQDNDCGARGYDALDLNEDCVIDLSEVAMLYSQWLLCTLPYDAGDDCDMSWNLQD